MATLSPVNPAVESTQTPAAVLPDKPPSLSVFQDLFEKSQQQINELRARVDLQSRQLDEIERKLAVVDRGTESQFWEKLNKDKEKSENIVQKALEENNRPFIKFLVQKKMVEADSLLDHFSAKEDLEMLSLLLEQGVDLSKPDDKGWTALDHASAAGREAVVTFFLRHIPNVDALHQNGRNCLHSAVIRGDLKLFEQLVAKGADIHTSSNHKWKAIHYAASHGHLPVLKRLMELGAKRDEKGGPANHTPLHEAITAEVAEYLLELKVPVDILADNNWIPLHCVVSWGPIEVVKTLIARGAAINALTKDGNTPLDLASQAGHDAIVTLLLAHIPDVDALNQRGENYLYTAARHGDMKLFERLLTKGAKIDTSTSEGGKAIHGAAKGGHLPIVKRLVELGAKQRGPDNCSPLHHASTADVAQYLLDLGVPVDIPDDNTWTPLHFATRDNRIEVAKILLERGADINRRTSNFGYRTPSGFATSFAKGEMVLLLTDHEKQLNKLDKIKESGADFVPEVLKENDRDFIQFLIRTKRIDIDYFLLRHFSAQGDSEMVRFLLERGALINKPDNKGWTALDHASQAYPNLTLFLLLDRIPHADIDTLHHNGRNYLHMATLRGDIKLFDQLVAKGAKIDAPTSDGWKAIHIAANRGHLPVVKRLIALGAKGDEKGGRTNHTPLHEAITPEVAQYLHIDQKVQVDILDNNEWTPLHVASFNNRLEVFQFLITHGANIHAFTKSPNNWKPIHIAAGTGHLHAVKRLIELGAKADDRGGVSNSTSLHWAFTAEVAHYLLDQGVPVDIRDDRNWTPLHWAAEENFIAVARCLLARGADLNKTTSDGQTPLVLAKSKEMIELLKEHQKQLEPSILETIKARIENIFTPTRSVKVKQESEGLLTASSVDIPLLDLPIAPVYTEEHRIYAKSKQGLLD